MSWREQAEFGVLTVESILLSDGVSSVDVTSALSEPTVQVVQPAADIDADMDATAFVLYSGSIIRNFDPQYVGQKVSVCCMDNGGSAVIVGSSLFYGGGAGGREHLSMTEFYSSISFVAVSMTEWVVTSKEGGGISWS